MRRLLILAAVAAVAATLFAAYLGFSPAPNTAVGFNNRGEAYRAKAQYERAIAPNARPVLPQVALGVVDGHPIDTRTALVLANAFPRSYEIRSVTHLLH